MSKTHPRLGAHMSVSGGFHLSIDRGEETGCETMQILTKNNRQWKAPAITSQAADAFLTRKAETKIGPIFIHAIYLINLCSPNDATREKSLAAMEEELVRAEILDLPWAIIHPGSHGGLGEERGLELIAEGCKRAIDATPDHRAKICLETTAGQGTALGYRFEHIARLFELIDAEERLCVCMDTCHIFSAGYDFRTKEGYEKVIADFDNIIGLQRLACMHINDSKTKFGLRKDRHENIGEGHIGLEPFRFWMNDQRLAHVPMVIETPVEKDEIEEDRKNLQTLRDLKDVS